MQAKLNQLETLKKKQIQDLYEKRCGILLERMGQLYRSSGLLTMPQENTSSGIANTAQLVVNVRGGNVD